MVDVRLPAAAADAELLGARLPTTPNTWVATGAGRAIWLGPDEWLLTSTAHAPDELDGPGTRNGRNRSVGPSSTSPRSGSACG